MVPAYRHSGPMARVYLVIVCLLLAGVIRGFVEALAEVSVGAGAEVVAEADLVIGGRFKLASNCRKDGCYAKR